MHIENPPETNGTPTFKEDRLKLLSPEISTFTAQEFYDRILSFYQPRATGGKAKEAEIKGKKLKSPTKKAFGLYEMRYQTALGERSISFTYDKRNLIRAEFIQTIREHLLCAEQKVLSFFEKKKFSLSTCPEDALQLQEIFIPKKETNADSKN